MSTVIIFTDNIFGHLLCARLISTHLPYACVSPLINPLIFITTLRGRCYYYPHCGLKTEAQRGKLAQGHMASKWQSWNSSKRRCVCRC